MQTATEEMALLYKAVRRTLSRIDQSVGAADAFQEVAIPEKSASAYRIDVWAEETLHSAFQTRGKKRVCVGEESPLSRAELEACDEFVASDALDGSTWLKMGLWGNWAVVVAVVENKPIPSIRTAAVGMFDAMSVPRVLCANREIDGAFEGAVHYMPRLSSATEIAGARIACSANKPSRIRLYLEKFGAQFDTLGLFLNISGAPAVMRVLTGHVDAVFSQSRGYDFAPAAFVAEQAGAYVRSWDGKPLQYREALLDPSVLHTWMVAATPELGRELASILA
ncbi:MAG: hypothetical protein AAB633_01635 [Patescibacteria group bacterium]